MDEIKRSFEEIKIDISYLDSDLNLMKEEFTEIKQGFKDIVSILGTFKEKLTFLEGSLKNISSTQDKKFPAEIKGSSTHQYLFEALKGQNMGISIGNEGVSTDRQTDRQTDKNQEITPVRTEIDEKYTKKYTEKNTIDSAADIIDSLDNIKKQIRLKFKKLTDQEMLVFSVIYQFDEEKGYSNYKMLANKLKLTESSIRDYVGRLLKKQIPIEKTRTNNKEIELTINKNLRKITSLSTILKLREL